MKSRVLDAIAYDIDEMALATFLGTVPNCPVRASWRQGEADYGHCPSFFKRAYVLRPAAEEVDGL